MKCGDCGTSPIFILLYEHAFHKNTLISVSEMLYADDLVLTSETTEGLREERLCVEDARSKLMDW